MPWYIWLGLFLALLAIALSIVFPVYIEVADYTEFSRKEKIFNSAYPFLISLVSAFVLFAGVYIIFPAFPEYLVLFAGVYIIFPAFSRVLSRLFLVEVALYAFSRALRLQSNSVQSTSIGPSEGSVVVSLETGSHSGVVLGTRFRITNTATGEVWGIIAAVEVDNATCVCSVSNRNNPRFWEELEGRMDRDASPPQGVTIRREFPEEIMDLIRELLDVWGS